jgi:hypothetical protein
MKRHYILSEVFVHCLPVWNTHPFTFIFPSSCGDISVSDLSHCAGDQAIKAVG